MNKIQRIKELTEQLHKASVAYYKYDNPIMEDKQYDDLYNELELLEKDLGTVLAGSPTQKVQGYIIDGFKKATHTKPMLSAAKTKDISEIERFIGNNDFYCSYKLDGLTLVVKYKNGKFVQGTTRGDGYVGEDVTEQCKFISNLPMKISNKEDIELRGECVISWEDFRKINNKLETPYTHPRNLASGTLRNLDLNIVKERKLSFIAFEIVKPIFSNKMDGLKIMDDLGFETVGRCTGKVFDCTEGMQPEFYKYPVDGLIFELNDIELSNKLGQTSHHDCCRIALKWADELYETKLRDIEWNTSKTGLINPVAIFEPIDLDGAITTRATLHNVSYIEGLQLGIGDTIQVYRANMVIPKVHDNLTKSDTWILPEKCPNCGGEVEIHNENGSKTLHCKNDNCNAKLIGKLSHAVSKNALNIDGLSEATLEKFIELGWLSCIKDIYYLYKHAKDIKKLEGFGEKSVENLLTAIEVSRNITLDKFIYALSIPLIGRTASRDISKCCNGDIYEFIRLLSSGNKTTLVHNIEGFGTTMLNALSNWWNKENLLLFELIKEFTFNIEETSSKNNLLGKTFVVTGSVNQFKNRGELVSFIEDKGGKVTGSVTHKTTYLINNDKQSASSKNKKAKELGVEIISEEDFLKMI